jgi:signal transduction histidine kinase
MTLRMKAATQLTAMMLAYLALIDIAYTVVADRFAAQNFWRDLEAEASIAQRFLDDSFSPDVEQRRSNIVRNASPASGREDLRIAVLDESGRPRLGAQGFPMSIPASNWISAQIKSGGAAEFMRKADGRWWFYRIERLKAGSGYLLLARQWTLFGGDRRQITLTTLGFLLLGTMGIVLLAHHYVTRLLAEVHKRLNNLSERETLADVPSRCKVKVIVEECEQLDELFANTRYRLFQECERRRRLERRKLKADQLAASANLASGFAHEIGTPLGIIRGLAEMLMTGTFEQAEITDNLGVIITQIDEISRMVRLLLDIGRSRSAIRIASDVRTIAETTIQLLRPQAARRGVEVIANLGSRPLIVDCDPDQLQRVFTNIEANALEAMVSGGQLRVNSASDEVNGDVKLSFEDTGPGVPTEIRGRIFDAFFTTKSTGQSDGIGLTVSQSVIADHDGELTLEQHGQGACFVVTLPSSKPLELSSRI